MSGMSASGSFQREISGRRYMSHQKWYQGRVSRDVVEASVEVSESQIYSISAYMP